MDCRTAGLALTKTACLVSNQMLVKLTEHFFNLLIQLGQVGRITKFVKKNSVSFNFRNLEPDFIGINQRLKQFLYNKTAMINFRFVHKPGKAAYIRNEKQPFIFHFYFKVINCVRYAIIYAYQF